jgi:hypothetical protein
MEPSKLTVLMCGTGLLDQLRGQRERLDCSGTDAVLLRHVTERIKRAIDEEFTVFKALQRHAQMPSDTWSSTANRGFSRCVQLTVSLCPAAARRAS